MAYSKSLPWLLQARPADGEDGSRQHEGAWVDGVWHPAGAAAAKGGDRATGGQGTGDKGDRRTRVEAPKPNEEREVGDLERGERETHGRA